MFHQHFLPFPTCANDKPCDGVLTEVQSSGKQTVNNENIIKDKFCRNPFYSISNQITTYIYYIELLP